MKLWALRTVSNMSPTLHDSKSRFLIISSKVGRPFRFGALHKKSWAVIDRPYSLGFATVGALYERPRYISCAKPREAAYRSDPDGGPDAKEMKQLAIACALFRFYCRLIPRDWYRKRPFIPVPPAAYVRCA